MVGRDLIRRTGRPTHVIGQVGVLRWWLRHRRREAAQRQHLADLAVHPAPVRGLGGRHHTVPLICDDGGWFG
ncbi:MAG TPA: hypothetical protein VF163_14710 [Micromonosporaceae bacterium]